MKPCSLHLRTSANGFIYPMYPALFPTLPYRIIPPSIFSQMDSILVIQKFLGEGII